MTLLELAERCEKAAGPDDATDWAIAEAVRCAPGLPYTSSLDAAITLVPQQVWSRQHFVGGGLERPLVKLWSDYGPPTSEGQASTEALALCAAALRTRSTQGDKG